MADYCSVANLAMSLIGEDDQIRDPEEDSHAARSVRAVWDDVRRAVLRRGKWNFATLRADIAAQVGGPSSYPYENRFPMPDGFLRLVEVLGPDSIRQSYKFEANAVLADCTGPVYVAYITDVELIGLWDTAFINAFAHRLAYHVADRITGDRGRKADAWTGYLKAVAEAAGVDAKEDPPTVPEEDDWILARVS